MEKIKVIESLITVLKNGNEPARGYSAIALGEIRDPIAIEPLIERLSTDTDPDVRGEAALSLGKILSPLPMRERVRVRGKIAIDTLIASLKDNDAMVRINAAISLGVIKDSGTVDSLIETINSEDFITYPVGDVLAWNYQTDVQCKAIECLGEIGDKRAIEPLIKLLNDGYSADAEIIFNSLSKIRDEGVVKFLFEKVKDKDSAIRKMAVRALGNIVDNPAVEDTLISSLLDLDSSVRIASAKALSNLQNKERILVPLILLLSDRDKEVKKEVAKIVAKIGNDRVIDHIIAMLEDSDADIRTTAAELLGNTKNREVVKYLISLLDDDNNVAIESITALKKLKAQDAFEPLLSIIKDKERTKEVRGCAVQTIGCIGGMEAEKYLLDKLNSDEEMKIYIIYSLGIIGSANCNSVLLSLLNDENKNVKRASIKALGMTKSPYAVEFLLNLLNTAEQGSDVDTILDIISSLCNIGDLKAVEPLINFLKNNNPVIRRQCIITLGLLGDKRATDLLISALKDEDSAVRREAVISLGNIGDNKAVEPLIFVLFDPERFIDIRADISKSLKKIGDIERTVNMLIDVLNDSNKSPYHWVASESIGEIYKKEAIG